jgi:hypothetical protein
MATVSFKACNGILGCGLRCFSPVSEYDRKRDIWFYNCRFIRYPPLLSSVCDVCGIQSNFSFASGCPITCKPLYSWKLCPCLVEWKRKCFVNHDQPSVFAPGCPLSVSPELVDEAGVFGWTESESVWWIDREFKFIFQIMRALNAVSLSAFTLFASSIHPVGVIPTVNPYMVVTLCVYVCQCLPIILYSSIPIPIPSINSWI